MTVGLNNGFGVANSIAGTRNGDGNDLHNIDIYSNLKLIFDTNEN